MSAADSTLAPSAAQPPADNAGASRPRHRLFLKYALLFVALVSATLLVTSGFEFWFSYHESKATLVRIQQEKADAAAARIREFVDEIQRQIGWTTHAQWEAGPLDQRRQDYFRLLRQVPPITELTQLDRNGREQLKVSRLSIDAIGSEADFSQSPVFTRAKAQRVWFSPVYFRKQSEPYMTLAVANDGRNAGVTVAEINLKLIQDVIAALRIGQGGYAYVVDGRGRLIAHPDISLVLRDTDLSQLPQVAAALLARNIPASGDAGGPAKGSAAERLPATAAPGLAGGAVLTAHAAIDPLGWLVFVEVPRREAFAPLYGAAFRTGLLLLLGLAAATLVALLLARRMTGPIRAIAEGAERLGRGELDRRLDIHTGDELEGLAQQFNRMAGDLQKSYAELEQRVRDRTAELSEALDQQTATAEVLGVINSSPGDLAPVFDAMLDKALRLCGAALGELHTYDGERFHTVAVRGASAAYAEARAKFPPSSEPGTGSARILETKRPLHILDLIIEEAYRAGVVSRRTLVDLGGARTSLAVPLLKDEAVLGVVMIYRQEVRPFSDKQIALLQNFAAQAVIAMENARLITETRDALEQQTATAEVLGVINASPGDLVPVFDAMVERAARLCEADEAALRTFDGQLLHLAAVHGSEPEVTARLRRLGPTRAFGLYEPFARGERVAHYADVRDLAVFRDDPVVRERLEIRGIRTWLAVALQKDGALLGVINVHRHEVRPFTEKQIALLQNFAAQAVIAMENARLITETREALEQQTATAEVLQVINSSPGDLAPVFDAMLEMALKLCEASFGNLLSYDGELFHVSAAAHEDRGVSERYRQRAAFPPPPGRLLKLVTTNEDIVFVEDVHQDLADRNVAELRELVDAGGYRSILNVALRKEGRLLGVIGIFRRDVQPFTDKQIALLQNFAAQAVIAMENARLITETREALEQQTATSEVLQVINSSPGNLDPVFDAMLEKATRLCEAAAGTFWVSDEQGYRAAAIRGMPRAFVEVARSYSPGTDTPVARIARGEGLVHLPDLAADDTNPSSDPLIRAGIAAGIRTLLSVPLKKGNDPLGVFSIYRREVRPFGEKQISLVQNFAAQAVIAMENARLLIETRDRTRDLQESLDYQTATSDVLKVISQSTFDLQPVLETVVRTAIQLCRADHAGVYLNRDGEYRRIVGYGLSPVYDEIERNVRILPGPGTVVGRAALERRTAHIPDAWVDPLYEAKKDARIGGAHTMLGVPLLREGACIGVVALARNRLEPFADREIQLVTTFADQAVIAIENARLLNELRERTDELAHSVEELKALSEVGQAVSSTLDLGAVLSTILNRSVGLTGSDAGAIFRYRRAARSFRLFEAVGWDENLVAEVGKLNIAEEVTAIGDAIARRAPVQIADLERRASNPLRDINLAAGYRAALIVPLVGADRAFGAIVLQRRAAGEYPEATVRLMQTLASQSVLAIQNARLFNEIAEKSEQLAEASRHKSQFLANMSHELRTPLNAILGYTELMVDGIYGELSPRAAGVLERVQNNGKHLLALINDVLDLAKIEAGQLVLTLEDYALPDVVHSVVSATEGLANTKGLNFTAEIAPCLPTGHGDARRLAQVLLNLVGNAVKFTDAGEVAIRAAAENGSFVLTVRDTGPGIAPDDHGKIFEEFQQVDSSNTRKKGGTGLGLAISKRMVEMQGGTITVASELGRGATFRVRLPVRVEDVADELGALAGEMRGAA